MDRKDINCIILCGGKGSRMNSPSKHKVCFEIDGVPAINRIISSFKSADVEKITVVVGSMAGQVIECAGSAFEGIAFAYQKTPLGTGDAVRCGIKLLKNMGSNGPILITMGDKLIDRDIIERLVDKFIREDLDGAFVVQPRKQNISGGRTILDYNGAVRGICESIDIKTAFVYRELYDSISKSGKYVSLYNDDYYKGIIEKYIPEGKKRGLVLSHVRSLFNGCTGSIIDELENRSYIKLGNDYIEPSSAEESEYVNSAVYIFKPEPLSYALDRLSSNNVQNEIYLTDVVNILANAQDNGKLQYKVDILPAQVPYSIMTYNNAEELLRIEDYFASLKQNSSRQFILPMDKYKPVNDWIRLFEYGDAKISDMLAGIYGDNEGFNAEKRSEVLNVLKLFKAKFGENKSVVISRAPGRVNLMGRHVEHRGGFINVISINKEIICAASPREDDIINITNTDGEFEDRSFNISSHLVNLNWKDWLSYLESDEIKKMVTDSRGDWMNYVKAAVLRLQYKFKDRKLSGMDMAFSGNIPKAAGLSSSSAVVVAAAEAAVTLNNLDVTPQDFIDLCGEGEWFVGSRGGSGDHAAMKYGMKGKIVRISFMPCSPGGTYAFPEDCSLIVANSLVKAQKTTNARDIFNQRVASYEFGLMLLKERFPQYAEKMEYLRDVNTENLGVKPSRIYEMLMELPEKVTPGQIFTILPEKYHPRIRQIMSSHDAPDYYIIRPVILFCLSECERSKHCMELLSAGSLEMFGRLMDISHDGDRVVSYDDSLKPSPYDSSADNSYLKNLISDLESEDPVKVLNAQLRMQPGGYSCSTPETDLMADIARRVPGVYGTQLSGAGLGGCIMILAKKDAVDNLISQLNKKYYSPRNLKSSITVCSPVNGSSTMNV